MAVRDLGVLAWRDDLAWLEKQKGARWNAAVRSENQRFRLALKNVKQIKPTLKAIQPLTQKSGWKVYEEDFSPLQTWTNGTLTLTNVSSADVQNDLFAASIQDSDGYERFTLKVYRDNVEIFSLASPVGPTVFFSGDRILYLGSSKDLRYDSVMSLSLTSYTATTLYSVHTNDPIRNLKLNLAEDGSVYVTEGDFVDVRFGFIEDGSLKWHPKKVSSLFVVNRTTYILNGDKGNIELASEKGSWTIRRSHGIRTLERPGHPSVTVWGEVTFDPRDPMVLHVADIRYEPYTIHVADDRSFKKNPKPYPYTCTYSNEIAPTFVIRSNKNKLARGLLVTGNGAYGNRTKVGNLVSRWKGLLDRGWIVASVGVPGGGDHDDVWKKAGQRLNRLHSIEVFTQAIRGLQEKFNIGPQATALYGRSAGGQLVAATAHRTPGLVGAVYAESPYVDALRTISNPSLPLTVIETREFGSVTKGSPAVDMLATATWSPMEHIPSGSDNPLFVIARTDLNDLEVFPYEAMKWVSRLRAAGHEALLYVHKGRGHFTTTAETRAEDLSLLDSWLSHNKNLSYKYKMSAPMRNKNRSEKNKNKQKNKEGGARRKMTMRKSKKSRSTRKVSRKH